MNGQRRFNRRDFLRLAGASGLWLMTTPRLAAQSGRGGPFWVFVNAAGGWDPTSLCDPKGRANEDELNPVNMYFSDEIASAGNIQYAPIGYNADFFTKYSGMMTVINGIDTETVNHSTGSQYTWSGRLADGYPSLAALIAAEQGKNKPMSFVTFGGFDVTMGVVSPTRIGNNLNGFNRMAYPNSLNGNPDDGGFYPPGVYQQILDAQSARREYLLGTSALPKRQGAITQLHDARVGNNEVRRLAEFLPEEFENDPLRRQVQLTMAAFRAGVSVSANLDLGGFDTHGNHDNAHYPRLQQLLEGVDYLWEQASIQDIADDLIVVVGSDFGRTPGYNSGNGKDHWSITSMMVMGNSIPGNRVIGTTDERHNPIEVDPETLEPNSSTGIRLTPAHVHDALRRLSGLSSGTLAMEDYPILNTESLPILG